MGAFQGIRTAVDHLFGSGVQSQGNLNILDKILRKWKYIVAHAGGGGAASAEVGDLVVLIDRSTGLRKYGTAAGNKAPSVKCTAIFHGDAAVGCHLDIAIISYNAALFISSGGKIPATYAYGTVDRDGGPLRHGQCAVGFSGRCGADNFRGRSIQRTRRVKGDRQGDTAGDCVSTAGQSTVREQHNLVLTVCRGIGVGLVQIVESHTAGLKNRAGCGNEHRLDGLIGVKVQRSRCVRGQIFAAGHAVPAEELIAGGRGRHQSIGHVGLLGFACFGCDLHTIHRIASVLSWQEGGSGAHIGN